MKPQTLNPQNPIHEAQNMKSEKHQGAWPCDGTIRLKTRIGSGFPAGQLRFRGLGLRA